MEAWGRLAKRDRLRLTPLTSFLQSSQKFLEQARMLTTHTRCSLSPKPSAVSWPGNRNTRAAVTGAMIGAHLESADLWEQDCSYVFEDRYNEAIHTGRWKGFKKTRPAADAR